MSENDMNINEIVEYQISKTEAMLDLVRFIKNPIDLQITLKSMVSEYVQKYDNLNEDFNIGVYQHQ